SEPQSPHVKRGGAATVELPAFPGERFPAKVARVATVLDPASRTMRAEIGMGNQNGRVRPGMTARVALELRRIEEALTVPVAALRVDGEERSVFTVEGGIARRAAVTTGMESAEWIEVVEGLEEGSQVVVATAGRLEDGVKVRVQP
ncbi:MAG: efflux RND transporter periplasmic adaptor subunit, partial [bacterium]|nr:efflux RND transporter periplasmic adaptor subunit [bacterium]